jgi:hypothetical protein
LSRRDADDALEVMGELVLIREAGARHELRQRDVTVLSQELLGPLDAADDDVLGRPAVELSDTHRPEAFRDFQPSILRGFQGFPGLPGFATNSDESPITLSQAYTLTAADVYISSAIGVNYGPVTVSGSGTNYTITLAQPINAADVITLIIDNPGVSVFYHQLDVLPGDFNDDGLVNRQDLAGIRNEWLGVDGANPTIFSDINGDGTVNIADYNAERLLIGTSLPSASAALIAPGTGSQSGSAVVRIGTTGPSPHATASQARPRAEIQLSGRGWRLVRCAVAEHECRRWRKLRCVERLAGTDVGGIGGRCVHGCDH